MAQPIWRGAIMRRMGQIHTELDEITRSKMPLAERASKSDLLKQELAELTRKAFGEQRRPER